MSVVNVYEGIYFQSQLTHTTLPCSINSIDATLKLLPHDFIVQELCIDGSLCDVNPIFFSPTKCPNISAIEIACSSAELSTHANIRTHICDRDFDALVAFHADSEKCEMSQPAPFSTLKYT
jgi:hypothetical protein